MKFSKTDSRKVTILNTSMGLGVFAVATIRRGEMIAAFDGPILDNDFDDWNDDLLNHAIQIGENTWRDSKGIARLINHSCEPNCGVKKLIRIVAMRTIYPGEEITWDYEMTEKNSWWRMKCRCQTPSCRGKIGNYQRLPPAVRRKYKGFISEWLTLK
jgi:SET domain-containing protein